ncbi:MAG: hypothetical protein J7576_08095 [Siphonobacter aquaeclarae]|nr:hypothetical protein [Siphonobacter aquaeclarae]
MSHRIIRLGFRKLISRASDKPWEQFVYEDTRRELFMQAQYFNPDGKYATFSELIAQVPAAEKLHALTSTAAVGYLRQLDGKIPDILNAYGRRCLPFSDFRFEVIQSHFRKKEEHTVAVTFYSDPLTWIDMPGTYWLVAYGDRRDDLEAGREVETDLIPQQPFLSIHSLRI